MHINVRNRVEKINLEQEVDLAEFSTMKSGGKADLCCHPTDLEGLRVALAFARDASLPVTVLGGMSNVLISDGGIEGLVVRTTDMSKVTRRGNLLSALAGARLDDVVDLAIEEGLGGLEHFYGIPGTIGGALRGNAGAHGHEISEKVLFVDLLDPEGNLLRKRVVPAEFSYRTSPFKGRDDLILHEIHLALDPVRDTHALKNIALGHKRSRIERRQYEYPSLGSIFKNPPGLKAGALLEDLKGTRIGGALIAPHHANMIINADGRATSQDVRNLILLAKERVFTAHGITLEEEIVYLGRW
ncbi:MAG: UDP-N-acetylmuramate dehydrogenase [Spirochaetales bacterium]|nr:UDP-N-acetylmuramate dehydrogenase [Spirochaetales bacterium]